MKESQAVFSLQLALVTRTMLDSALLKIKNRARPVEMSPMKSRRKNQRCLMDQKTY